MPRSKRTDNTSKTSMENDTVLGINIHDIPQPHTNDNPLWLGPCGKGWNGGITQSMLSRFFSCRERFRLRYILGLEPHSKWNHRFGYGNMWHVCEQALAAGWSNGANLQILTEHTDEQLQKYPLQRGEITKWYNVCCVQFPEYVKYWSEHPDVKNRTPLMQEQVFDVPYTLPSGRIVRLRGRWDSVDLITETNELHGRHRTESSGIWLQENKTKGEIDKLQIERQLTFDLQTMVYLVAMQEYKVMSDHLDGLPRCDSSIKGVRFNVVRRPLSGGKGNITMYKAKKTVPAETEEHFYERLRKDYIAAEPDYWFFRVRAEITPHCIEVFRKTCLDPLLEQLCYWYNQITGVQNPNWCPANYRTPFGIFNSLTESGATEYDGYLATGTEIGLCRTEELFTELK